MKGETGGTGSAGAGSSAGGTGVSSSASGTGANGAGAGSVSEAARGDSSTSGASAGVAGAAVEGDNEPFHALKPGPGEALRAQQAAEAVGGAIRPDVDPANLSPSQRHAFAQEAAMQAAREAKQ